MCTVYNTISYCDELQASLLFKLVKHRIPCEIFELFYKSPRREITRHLSLLDYIVYIYPDRLLKCPGIVYILPVYSQTFLDKMYTSVG